MGIAERYASELDSGALAPDPAQAALVKRLAAIDVELGRRRGWVQPKRSLFARWLPSVSPDYSGVRGLYVWGGVGRGKTHLADLFFESRDFDDGVRLHFHSFMRRIHADLREHAGVENPLERVADDWAGHARLLLLDEIHVNDITDAMLLGGLLTALFNRGVTLVTTSNVPPDGLYRHGLQRARFLPAIAQIKKHCDVLEVAGGDDYRLRVLQAQPVWIVADEAGERMAALFERLAGQVPVRTDPLEIDGREVPMRARTEGVGWFDFRALCDSPLSTGDYIAIAERFHTVLIGDIPVFDRDADDAARRFVNLIDEFYDRSIRVVASAAAEVDELYRGDRLAFEFERAASRLIEMRSAGWMERTGR